MASLVEQPMPELATRAREYEALGFSDVWVPDERLLRNVYVSLATIATATTRIGMGPAVTNPYTRHPAHTAAAIATIDELSGGRATLAYGAGGGLDAYGVKRDNPVRALREAVRIAHLLFQGETVSFEGEAFSLRGTQIDFGPLRRIPVYLAARGPRILRLAGEVADGAIIGGFAEPGGLKYALDMVGRGIERAGRSRSDVDVMSWLYVSVDDDPAAARTAVSKIVLASLITSRPILDRIGIELPSSLRDHLDARGWRYPTETPREAARLLPDHIVDAFAVHGTPERVRERLRAIRDCGIDHVSFVLFPPAGASTAALARRIAQDVVSPLTPGGADR
ncbi:LLM class flavin-dependent oxidoreductase [Phytohabitans sp. ZYX-F-186]|uniref:LLM class flavin-dependent oxidoreductase n=1 Tax=Phytohabitans maris TaxID=3071409 RepID=A0ABU0ZGA3_9ACTN|nr:LLM class flavin-dependent oxidoreductase [Phytohabitans sp. ZYX-F-186]MDQ7906091.1 LLM class flavin-dependent oxidoreductase [Phytohabitans sp. ZYX-F-186]